jgi:hypothetical protein
MPVAHPSTGRVLVSRHAYLPTWTSIVDPRSRIEKPRFGYRDHDAAHTESTVLRVQDDGFREARKGLGTCWREPSDMDGGRVQ